MLPRQHFFFGTLFALLLFFIFPPIGIIGAIIIIFSTVFIDLDHYIYYVLKTKNFNLKRSYFWYFKNIKKFSLMPKEQKDKYYTGFCFLHGVEILIILFLFGMFLSHYFYYILIGFIFHLFLDVIEQIKLKKRIDKLFITYDFLKFKKLKLLQEDGRE